MVCYRDAELGAGLVEDCKRFGAFRGGGWTNAKVVEHVPNPPLAYDHSKASAIALKIFRADGARMAASERHRPSPPISWPGGGGPMAGRGRSGTLTQRRPLRAARRVGSWLTPLLPIRWPCTRGNRGPKSMPFLTQYPDGYDRSVISRHLIYARTTSGCYRADSIFRGAERHGAV